MKLNCAIIDDEPLAVELMAGYVRKTPFLTLCGSFGSGSGGFDMLRGHPGCGRSDSTASSTSRG